MSRFLHQPFRALPSLALALALLALAPVALPAGADPIDENPCTDTADATRDYTVDVDGDTATGVVAFPEQDPRALVVFAHGYSHASSSWVEHSRWAAIELGAAAVAMDYRGTHVGEDGAIRGWQVAEGAADMIAAARDLERLCGGFDTIVIFGVSMGGNSSGLALAAQPTRLDGTTPLFDWWFDLEGAANVIETYQGARALAAANTFARYAQADIEAEMGGTFEEVPEVYADRAVVNRVDDIAASGVKGVYMVHGVEDGLVPFDQAAELHALLTEAGVPTTFDIRVDNGGAESGTTLSGYAVEGSPLAGHASETSTTHVVMRAGFDRLRALLVDGEPICNATTLSNPVIRPTISWGC